MEWNFESASYETKQLFTPTERESQAKIEIDRRMCETNRLGKGIDGTAQFFINTQDF